jgi:hypothetical protein
MAIESVPKHYIPELRWRNWVPVEPNYGKTNTPLYNNFRCLQPTNNIKHEAPKICTDKRRAPYSRVSWGAHYVLNNTTGADVKSQWCGLYLDHFPVRSSNQIIAKALLADKRINMKQRLTGEHNHFWIQQLADQIREVNYVVDTEMLKQMGIGYGMSWRPNKHVDNESKFTPPMSREIDLESRFGSPQTDKMKYHGLSGVNPLQCLDKQLQLM